MAEAVVVVPDLFPVSPEEVSLLERKIIVPPALKEHWLSLGHGFFTDDADGIPLDPDIANRLVPPLEVLDLLENASDLAHEFVHGIPFFEMNDRRYLLLDEHGRVICAEVELRVVASSFAEFMHRIVREPLFYDEGLTAHASGVLVSPAEWRFNFGSALWIFNAEEAAACAVSSSFPDLAAKWSTAPLPFATDAFGDLWVVRTSGEVLRVNTEIFEPVHTYVDLDAWMQEVLLDGENEIGAEILARWERDNGSLPGKHRLMPKVPFVLGGGYDLDNLFAMPITEMLAARREMAAQLEGLPDGATVWIDTEDA